MTWLNEIEDILSSKCRFQFVPVADKDIFLLTIAEGERMVRVIRELVKYTNAMEEYAQTTRSSAYVEAIKSNLSTDAKELQSTEKDVS